MTGRIVLMGGLSPLLRRRGAHRIREMGEDHTRGPHRSPRGFGKERRYTRRDPPARARQVEGAGHHAKVGHPRPADRERGHEVQPKPAPTSWSRVSRLEARKSASSPSASGRPQRSATWSLRQWPSARRSRSSSRKSLDPDLLRLVQRVVEGMGDPERFVEEGGLRQGRIARRSREKRGVDLVRAEPPEQRVGDFLGEHQPQIRITLPERAQHDRHQIGAQGRDDPEAKRRRQGIAGGRPRWPGCAPASATMRRAQATMSSPAGVVLTDRFVRSKMDTPSRSSSLRIWPLKVGWLTWHASAARPK